jgi:hypothetical protein
MGTMRFGARQVPEEMSVGQEGGAAGAVEVANWSCVLVVVVTAVDVDDGRPRAAQLKAPVRRVIFVQLLASAMLSEKVL